MKNLIKAVSLILCLMLLPTSPIFAEGNTADAALESAFSVLSQLGITSELTIEEFTSQDTVSRGEFILSVCRLAGIEDMPLSQNAIEFSDVSKTNKYYYAISSASSLGLIKGGGDGKFRPNEKIDFAAAVKILVCLLGHGEVSESMGGYPAGYLTKAHSIGLLKGVMGEGGKRLQKRDAALLLYNALSADMLTQKIVSSETITFEDDGSKILEKYRGIKRGEGKLLSDYNLRMVSAGHLKEGEIVIGDNIYKTDKKVEEYIGMSVEYYYNSDDEIVAIIPEKGKNKTLTLKSSDIEKYENNVFRYYINDVKTLEASISKDADIAYNGRVLTEFDPKFLNPEEGKVTLIDTNYDNLYDSAIIESYRNFVVKGADEENGIIYDLYESGKTLSLDEFDSYVFEDELGNTITLPELQKYDVLSVSESADKSYVKILYSNSEIEGKILEKSGSDEIVLNINGVDFSVSDCAKAEASKLVVGESYLFLLDALGNVASMVKSDEIYHWGYLVAAKVSEGVASSTQVKIFADDSLMHIFTVDSDVLLNSKMYSSKDFYKALLGGGDEVKASVVRVRFSEDKLLELDTDIEAYFEGYNEDGTAKKSLRWVPAASVFGGKVAVGGNTKFFKIPTNCKTADDDEFSLGKSSDFPGDSSFNLNAYKKEENAHVADVIVRFLDADVVNITHETPIRIVDEVVKAIDEKGEVKDKIKFVGGAEYFVRNENVLNDVKKLSDDTKVHSLLKGDIVRISVGNTNQITKIELFYDRLEGLIKGNPTLSDGGAGTNARVVKAKVYAKDGDNIIITQKTLAGTDTKLSLDETETHFISKFPTIYKCFEENGKYTVRKATAADILDYKSVGNGCSEVVIHTVWGYPRTMVIY